MQRRGAAVLEVDPEPLLGSVFATGRIVAARCAYDFVMPRSRGDAGDDVFGSWRHHEIVRGILFRGCGVRSFCRSFLLTELEGVRRRRGEESEIGCAVARCSGLLSVGRFERIATRFPPENGSGRA